MQINIQLKAKLITSLVVIVIASLVENAKLNAQTVVLKSDLVHSNVGFSVSMGEGLTRITGK